MSLSGKRKRIMQNLRMISTQAGQKECAQRAKRIQALQRKREREQWAKMSAEERFVKWQSEEARRRGDDIILFHAYTDLDPERFLEVCQELEVSEEELLKVFSVRRKMEQEYLQEQLGRFKELMVKTFPKPQ